MKLPTVATVIPARYSAQRLPGKPLADIHGKPMIQHVYERAARARGVSLTGVATDDPRIAEAVERFGGRVWMTSPDLQSGTDRVAAVARLHPEIDIFVNVQGDEPFVNRLALEALINCFKDKDKNVQVASLMKKIKDPALLKDPNCVKVVVDKNMNSLLFSRSTIPFHRDQSIQPDYFEHIGVYAFRKSALMLFTKWPVTPLEAAEKIECLRYLENGIPLQMVVTEEASAKIDVPDDLIKAEAFLSKYH